MSTESAPTLAREYDELVIYHNDQSTGGEKAYNFVKERLTSAEGLPFPVKEYVKTSDTSRLTEQQLIASIDPDQWTILGGVGGDGTHRQLFQSLQSSNTPFNPERLAIWAVGGGSGSNLLRDTVSKEARWHPDDVLRTGRVESFYPIRCVITTAKGQKYVLYAATVIGFGVTHDMIAAINNESHRAKKIRNFRLGHLALGKYLVDPPEFFKELIKSRPFNVEQAGELITALELLFINGPHTAEAIHAPEVSLTGPVHGLRIDNWRSLPLTWRQLAKSRSPGHNLEQPFQFRTLEPLAFQIDGEDQVDGIPLVLPPDTQVKIMQSKRPQLVVTNKAKL